MLMIKDNYGLYGNSRKCKTLNTWKPKWRAYICQLFQSLHSAVKNRLELSFKMLLKMLISKHMAQCLMFMT